MRTLPLRGETYSNSVRLYHTTLDIRTLDGQEVESLGQVPKTKATRCGNGPIECGVCSRPMIHALCHAICGRSPYQLNNALKIRLGTRLGQKLGSPLIIEPSASPPSGRLSPRRGRARGSVNGSMISMTYTTHPTNFSHCQMTR